MLNDRLSASKIIAEKLFALETAIDDALISAGELTAAVPAARRRARVSAVVGQDAIELTGQALASLHEARSKIVAAHHAFAAVQVELGLGTRMGGDGWKPAASMPSETAPLQLVADRAA